MTIYEKLGAKREAQAPNKRQMEWYGRERSIFFHFGMNTFTGKEWGDGSESPSLFNPTECDVDSWVEAISKAGFACAILTAKHHDGFCLWQTKYTEHSIKNSPYKNGKGDIVREFTDACKKHGVKAGIYLSPWDRHEPSWGTPDYNDYYANQLTELMSNYGEIWECWWDGAGSTEASYDWERWAGIVRTLQPNAVIFGSLGATPWVDIRWVGNEKGDAGVPCYATIDARSLEVEILDELNHGKIGGNRFIPAETDVSIRPGWFHHDDQNDLVRSPSNLMELYFQSVGRGSGLLLNIPPNRKGQLSDSDKHAIFEFDKMLKKAFEKNLLKGATLSVSSEVTQAGALLDGGFYMPKENDTCPTLCFKLPNQEKINALMLSEAIELGHKIVGARVSCKENGAWRTLCEVEVVGYKQIMRFDAVYTDEIKIELTKCLDTPVIKGASAYFIEGGAQTEKRLVKITPVSTKIDGGVVEIDLGGIFTFDLISGENLGEQGYKLYLFNGTDYDLVKEGKTRGFFKCKLDTPSDGAYRLKIVFEHEIQNWVTFELE